MCIVSFQSFMHGVVHCMNWGREKACIKASLSFREMSHITPWLKKLELDSGNEVSHVFFGGSLGLPGRFRWPPQLGDRLRWATEGFVLPGAVGPPCVRSLPTKGRVAMAKQRSRQEVRPTSTSGSPRCYEPSSKGPSRLTWSVSVGPGPFAWS